MTKTARHELIKEYKKKRIPPFPLSNNKEGLLCGYLSIFSFHMKLIYGVQFGVETTILMIHRDCMTSQQVVDFVQEHINKVSNFPPSLNKKSLLFSVMLVNFNVIWT